MNSTFFDGHDEFYHHAKFGKHRTMLAGCRYENVVFFLTGRMPLSGKLPVLNLLTGQKSGFFAPQGRLVAPIHAKLGKADGHGGPLAFAKFHLSRHRGFLKGLLVYITVKCSK